MTKKSQAICLPGLALLVGAVGFWLRRQDIGGGLPLAALSAVVTILFVLAAVTVEREAHFSSVFRPLGVEAFLPVLAGLAILASAVLSFSGGLLRLLIAVLGVVSGLVILLDPLLRREERKNARFVYVLPVLFYTIKLFADFRMWEIDPALTDYCYRLFACIGFMLAAYYVGAYTFDKGGRRLLAFFSLVGLTFGFVSLQGAAMPELLFYSGSSLWMLRLSLDALLPIPSDVQASNE